MNPDMAKLISDNEQDQAHCASWWKTSTPAAKAAVILFVTKPQQDPLLEIVTRFAQLALGQILEKEMKGEL